ncbi:MAG: nitroreductase family protein, partial [Thermodesulfobacteriota bacterium]|nr:nitroreductase family protein [Thermodesulfobacteriota bacterium]
LGSIAQTICLAALAHGLGTCIQGQGVMYPEVVRKYTGIPDIKTLRKCSVPMSSRNWGRIHISPKNHIVFLPTISETVFISTL